MNDRELIQILRVCASGFSCLACEMRAECKGFGKNLVMAANRLEELLAENDHLREVTKMVPKWVSVEEQLPADETRVLALGADHVIHDMRWDKRATEWRDRVTGYAYFDYFITHWMPLPELPSTEEVE